MNELLAYMGYRYHIGDSIRYMKIDIHGPYWLYRIPVDPKMNGMPSEPAYPIPSTF